MLGTRYYIERGKHFILTVASMPVCKSRAENCQVSISRKNFWRFAGNREMEIDDGQDKWGDWEAGLDLGERSPIVLTTASALPPSFANLNTTSAEINNNSEKR